MGTIIQNSNVQAGTACLATEARKRKGRKSERNSTGSLAAIPTPDNAFRNTRTTLAVEVNSALRVSRQQPYGYFLAATLMGAGSLAQAQGFPASINLSDLNASDGFVLSGADARDRSGGSVSGAGDINGDGVDDLIIGAYSASPIDKTQAGKSYVVFGGSGVGSTGSMNLSALSGTDGFVLNGADAEDYSGRSVSGAGDINGDGIDDLIIGADSANPDSGGDLYAGESHVVFGSVGLGSTGSVDLSNLSSAGGFVLNGVNDFDYSGISVSGAGDINGDGVDDLIIGAFRASPNGNYSGESYVVFGGSGVGRTGSINLSDLSGSDGFVLNGADADDFSGASVSGAGDINGDGVNDLIIGAPGVGLNGGNSGVGESYVVFGGSGVGSTGAINLSALSGAEGFVLNGVITGDATGVSVSGAGDINDDGVDDLIIGAFNAGPNGNTGAGESYVVFGGSGLGSAGAINLSALSGADGFTLNGVDAFDRSGRSVSGAGDINGDGVDDLIIGADGADPNGESYAGASYVVFGGSGVGSTGMINLSALSGTDGFVLNGVDAFDNSGRSVSGAGDINGDGVADLIIGAPRSDPNGNSEAGESYVVFGKNASVTPIGPGPENDLFSNAEYLDGVSQAVASGSTLTVNGTTSGATSQGGEPAHFKGGSSLPRGPRNSIWYSWTAEADQVVEIDTAGSEVGTVLVAYTGATVSGLQEIVTGIDNVREVTRIRFATRVGETYHLAIDGYDNNSEGNIQLNIRQPKMDPSECTITGTNGKDVLTGTTGPDVICGLGGNDVIKSLGGADIIFAGKGFDFINSGGGNDIVFGEDGNDVLVGGSGNDLLVGGTRSDRINGGRGNDIVFGGSGADRLIGAAGNDDLFGEMGSDKLFGGPGNDYLDGGPFNDRCVDREGNDTLVGC